MTLSSSDRQRLAQQLREKEALGKTTAHRVPPSHTQAAPQRLNLALQAGHHPLSLISSAAQMDPGTERSQAGQDVISDQNGGGQWDFLKRLSVASERSGQSLVLLAEHFWFSSLLGSRSDCISCPPQPPPMGGWDPVTSDQRNDLHHCLARNLTASRRSARFCSLFNFWDCDQ